jgi:hypothetical protein
MRRRYRSRARSRPSRERGGHGRGRASPLTDLEKGADEAANHLMAKRVGDDARDDSPGRTMPDRQLANPAHECRLTLTAERREVVLTEGRGRSGAHRFEIQACRPVQRVAVLEGIRCRVCVKPVLIGAPSGASSGVEGLVHRGGGPNADLRRQSSVQSVAHPGDVGIVRRRERHHLAGRMHSGVGAPRADRAHVLAKEVPQAPLELPLDRALSRLACEAVEVCSVVREQQRDLQGRATRAPRRRSARARPSAPRPPCVGRAW